MKYKLPLDIIEIEPKNYHVFIDITIHLVAARFLIDTGASKTVMDSEMVLKFVKSEKIKSHESKSVGLGVSEMETHLATIKEVCFGKMCIGKMQVAVLPIGHVNTTYILLKIPIIDGVLGSDFLMKYKSVIDYKKRLLKFEK